MTTNLREVAAGAGLLLASSALFFRTGVGAVSVLLAVVAVCGALVAAARTASTRAA